MEGQYLVTPPHDKLHSTDQQRNGWVTQYFFTFLVCNHFSFSFFVK
jgi:hypothetical protein